MEEVCSFPYSGHLATSALQSILDLTFQQLKTRRLNHIMAYEMPADYLNYIGNVSMLLHSHREPTNTNSRTLHKTITEPAQAGSHQIHQPPLSRRLQPRSHLFSEEQALPLPPPTLQNRKQSVCLSHRSRVSVQRMPSRKIIHSRRKIPDANRLIPLTRATEYEDRNQPYQQKITQLRKRKVKLQEAMRAFREDDKPQRAQFKKSKENQASFTTDFKGKLISFNPKSTKTKPNQTIPFTFKFETLVQSGRSWANWGKVSSTTRRNLFRQATAPQRGSSEADLC